VATARDGGHMRIGASEVACTGETCIRFGVGSNPVALFMFCLVWISRTFGCGRERCEVENQGMVV
jgi:hypothetical protein